MAVTVIAGSGDKIDILASIEGAYDGVFRNWRTVLQLVWVPYIIVAATQLIGYAISDGGYFGAVAATLVRAFGFLVFGSVFIVRWQRFILFGEARTDEFFTAAWRGFFAAALKLTLAIAIAWIVLVTLALLPPHFLTILFPVIGGFALLICSVRVSLIFPAAAVEKPLSFRAAWDLIGGNTWRYFACAGICYLPAGLVAAGLGFTGAGAGWAVWLATEIGGLAVCFGGIAIAAGLAAEIYRTIVGASRRVAAAA